MDIICMDPEKKRMLRVWIACQPFVLADALTTLLEAQGSVEVLSDLPAEANSVDVGVFRLAATGELQPFFRPNPLPGAKLIVFSPQGESAFVRRPRDQRWERLAPFTLDDLLQEILNTPAR